MRLKAGKIEDIGMNSEVGMRPPAHRGLRRLRPGGKGGKERTDIVDCGLGNDKAEG